MKHIYKKTIVSVIIILFSVCLQQASAQIISTVAGNYRRSTSGYSGDGGPATNAQFNHARGIAFDKAGNLYIADINNNRIRKVDAITHVITTFAGNGTAGNTGDNGPALLASLKKPLALAADRDGNMYVGDANNVVRKIDDTTNLITTVAGNGTAGFSGDSGQATAASLNVPAAFAFDSNNNLFIADQANRRIRKVD